MQTAIFFIQSFILSIASYAQAMLHVVYEKLIPAKLDVSGKNNKILVVQLAQIGDFILSQPLFAALKYTLGKGSTIEVLVGEVNAELAQKNPYIDNVLIYNAKKHMRAKQNTKFSLLLLKDKTFDTVIWLRGDYKVFYWLTTNKIPMLSVAKYPNPLRWSWLPLITKRAIKRKFKHYIECLDDLHKKIRPSLFANGFIAQCGKNYQNDIFVHIGAGDKLRRWPEENFSILCEKLLKYNPDINIKLLGSKSEWAIAERVKNKVFPEACFNRITNICGEIPLEKLSAVLSAGKVYIGVDSGPVHIAAFSGIPIVVMMGPQSPQIFKPWGKQEIRVIYKNYFCSPCWQFSCLHTHLCTGACILAIQPDEVFQVAILLYKKNIMMNNGK